AHISTSSITMCHGRLSTPEAPTGRNPVKQIPPRWGLAFTGHSSRRVIELVEICAIDYRAFSPYNPSNCYMLKISHRINGGLNRYDTLPSGAFRICGTPWATCRYVF
ncbi:MAG: hypothetical protein LBC47_01525, partial [Tannerella sp.]|nr:hypothetical protein [Tannerella sp.]